MPGAHGQGGVQRVAISGLRPFTEDTMVCVSLGLPMVPASTLSPPVHSQFKINTGGEYDLECIV